MSRVARCVALVSSRTYKLLEKKSYPFRYVLQSAGITSNSYSNVGPQRWYSQAADTMNVDYEYTKKATSKNDILIVDVREPDEVKEHGKIPNSINIPLNTVTTTLSEMSEKEFQKVFNKPKPKPDTEIIFYCMIGKRSGTAQQNALNLGFQNAKNYVGSWTDWASKSK